jgi:hypothetical protein
MSDRRDTFLIEIYKQMFNDINRHILVVWQSVGVLVGAFAVLSLVEKKVISLDVATAIIVLLCAWLFAHIFDASYWYNRNLVIIANIERQFLLQKDLGDIHYYFGKHRLKNKMIEHLRIQCALGLGLTGIILSVHFYYQVLPGVGLKFSQFDPLRALPYVVAIASVIYCASVKKNRRASYDEFVKNSPGIDISTIGYTYGVGHGQT